MYGGSYFLPFQEFGQIAGLSTDGVPRILFYLCGTAIWGFFSSSLNSNSGTFLNNAGLFGKVYFPRLTVPISNMLTAAIRFGIQMLLVLIFLLVCSSAALPSAPALMKAVLRAVVVIGFCAALFASIVLGQYIRVGQGFLYEELKAACRQS